jgi:CDP-diacylglycerol pyrophosphatase
MQMATGLNARRKNIFPMLAESLPRTCQSVDRYSGALATVSDNRSLVAKR